MRTVEELWREAGDVRSSMPDALDVTNDSHTSFLYVLRNLYKSIILTNLDYALDKKVEQDLWNTCFKIPISGLQSNKSRKNSALLNWFLEGAAGFYMVLLQEICAQYEADPIICKQNIQLAIFNGPSYSVKPKTESFLYICQHCLIHLGDLARYRNLIGEAESYYKEGVRIEPSSGHPYNQLALLESARGDTLSTLFYYVRSLALKHPFPPAKINLETLLRKQLAYMFNFPKTRGGRLSAEEFVQLFLKLQGQIGLSCELDQAEHTINLLNLTWPSLVATEALSPAQLIRMLTITLYMVGECSGDSATDAQKRSLQLAIDVAASLFNACLTSCCALPDEQLPISRYLSVIKLVLDWLQAQPEVVNKIKRGQLWSSTAKILNHLQSCHGSGESSNITDDGKPLPEDLELLAFSPLRSVNRWQSTQPTQADEYRIRALRIISRGKGLAERSSGCLAMTHQPGNVPEYSFSSLKPESPIEKQTESLSKLAIGDETPKEIKILARPAQRNVALSAILKQKADDEPSSSQPAQEGPEPQKQVTFQYALAPPLPPVKPSTANYPRPSLPPRLERLKAEQKEREQIKTNIGMGGMYSSFGAASGLPDLSIPPPSVPPPGLGFPPPPAAWAMPGNLPPPPSMVPPYSLFSSATSWHPGQIPNFPSNLLPDQQQRTIQQLGPTSLWSGPGPSPLERLLEQQKATRGGASPNKK